ncbi:MAG TPA: patatin-like phospholipase family protein [Vicinamibacteria bacterium]|nr:patatin-like phospholipase family protein [Vicinamibacteria bacterium]
MREYSPRRRTALVLAGTGAAGAYHAGVLKALDESGVKLDLVVGSGAGAVAAAFAAVSGGEKLYGADGFWPGSTWPTFYRLKPSLRLAALLAGMAFGVLLLPVLLALVAGLLFPFYLLADLLAPALTARFVSALWVLPALMRTPYLAALSVPVFVLALAGLFVLGIAWLRHRRRLAEQFETWLDVRPGRRRLSDALWQVARGSAVSGRAPSEADLGRRFVSLAVENLGQPGFRELIVRAADLETGAPLPFVVLGPEGRQAFAGATAPGRRGRGEGLPGAVDLAAEGYGEMLFPAVMTGLLPPFTAGVCRVSFPKGGAFAGETHRLADATLCGGCGVAEALAAGAEQVIVAAPLPEVHNPGLRRRGPRAAASSALATLERQAVETELSALERLNRAVETLGHRAEDGRRAWEDPATGRVHREFSLYVVRPPRRSVGPLELDGVEDPATEVVETLDDLMEQGYQDAYRAFVEPVVGAVPEPRRPVTYEPEEKAVEL